LIRIAAVGDLHIGDRNPVAETALEPLRREADILLLAGDLTESGQVREVQELARVLARLEIPVVAVLGNHDYDKGQQDKIAACLVGGGVTVLEGDATTVDIGGVRLGIAGTKGFGGGFAGACASDFGEPEQKAFVRLTKRLADNLECALDNLDVDLRVALLHFSPIRETLLGEPPEIYAFLGSYMLGEAIDRAGADMVLHGHAHLGTYQGATAAGVPVWNVARPVIDSPYKLFRMERKRAVLRGGR
jgi:3',5'-cyclic AMP phosphodiesterase CpdA